MRKIGILTDSASYLSDELLKRVDIRVCYLNVIIDGTSYKEIIEIDNETLFKKIKEGKKVTTTQPSPEEFFQVYNEFKNEGYTDVISILMSSKASGTYQSAVLASQMVEGINFHFIDTLQGAVGEEIVVERVVELLDKKIDLEAIFNKVNKLIQNIKLKATVEDLRFFARSGRLKMTQALLGNILNFKPIIRTKEGLLELATKIRTTKRVIEKFAEDIKEDFKKCEEEMIVKITHVNAKEKAEEIKKRIEEISDKIKVSISKELGPAYATHFGPGGFAVAWTTL